MDKGEKRGGLAPHRGLFSYRGAEITQAYNHSSAKILRFNSNVNPTHFPPSTGKYVSVGAA